MLDLECFSEAITWIDLSFVARKWTPEWAIHHDGFALWDSE